MTATKPRSPSRCHFCERPSPQGNYQPFTDGKRRWVCLACIERQKIDAAQDEDETNERPIRRIVRTTEEKLACAEMEGG